MQEPKGDELDRDEVIEWYEKEGGIRLTRVNNKKRKILHDQTGRLYCLLVARETWKQWHGLDREILDNEIDWVDGVLIIAIRHKKLINIYEGPIRPLVQRKDFLSKGYKFHTREKGDWLFVSEVPDFSLKKVGTANNPKDLRVLMEKLKENPALMDKLMEHLDRA